MSFGENGINYLQHNIFRYLEGKCARQQSVHCIKTARNEGLHLWGSSACVLLRQKKTTVNLFDFLMKIIK